MSVMYEYTNLAAVPSQGILADEVAASDMAQKVWEDISYHPEEKWLKIWFEEDLSTEDQSTLSSLVDDCLGVHDFRVERNSVFFEFVQASAQRWERHRRRIRFQTNFSAVPTVTLSNVVFDGTANIEILDVTKEHFDFRVTAVNAHGSVRVRGLIRVEFDWEAKAWQA